MICQPHADQLAEEAVSCAVVSSHSHCDASSAHVLPGASNDATKASSAVSAHSSDGCILGRASSWACASSFACGCPAHAESHSCAYLRITTVSARMAVVRHNTYHKVCREMRSVQAASHVAVLVSLL